MSSTETPEAVADGSAGLPPTVRRILEILGELKTEEVKTFMMETFQRRDDDLIVTTFPKSGTTLVCHICYQIAVLSGGYPPNDVDGESAEDFALQAPFLEFMALFDEAPSQTTPRVFRSHSSVRELRALKCRHVVVLRDPTHFPASALNFVWDAFARPEERCEEGERQAFRALADLILTTPSPESDKGLSAWHASVCGNTEELSEDVLVLFYEDVVADYRKAVVRIAGFMNCDVSSDAVDTVVKRCDRQYMMDRGQFLQHEIEKLFETKQDFHYVLPENTKGFKRFALDEQQEARLEAMNMKAFGVKTYQEFRDRVNQEQKERFGH